ncbi:peptidase [Brevundimonas phage vB_BpoS-Kikimora]|uniref:Peptidase n=1 Tax=Brevundimonas phage vB_BpoS-Kikimora TaxID=2948601 RepID=A0A9E7SLE8_9CAUD|nr:peptidase [Brevundimonas phage vB_BpoS-Kikimora]
MRLSDHFTLAEFIRSDTAARLKNNNMPTPAHQENLRRTAQHMEQVRWVLGDNPITVTSAYRNPAVNRAVGGVSNSAHALGWAIDFVCPSFGDPLAICREIERSSLNFDQLIHERKPNGSWWVHISFDPRMRRQCLTYNGTRYIPGIHPVNFGGGR